MRRLSAFLLAFVIVAGILMPATTAYTQEQLSDWEIAMNRSLDWIYEAVAPHPLVGSVGGEWAVLALARAGRVTVDDAWVQGWLADVERMLLEVDRIKALGYDINTPPSAGTFPGGMRRWTDFQRLTLALSSLGLDASDFNGRDLTAIYREFIPASERHALNMTINVDTFALIALDTMPHYGDRMDFVDWLIEDQAADGAWSLGTFSLDVTAMAIQSLARYYHSNNYAQVAVDLALDLLRAQTFPDPESTAQMIVALTALGEDFAEEASYYVQWLLRWFDEESGGFRRPTPTSPVNLMATEQAAYALVAYWRLSNGKTALYDMSDMFEDGGREMPELQLQQGIIGLPGRHADIRPAAIILPYATEFSDATIIRAEFTAIITSALGLPYVTANAFHDVPANAWYFQAVGTAFFYEIVSGTTQNTFNPSGIVTRQEAAVMISRAARLAGINTDLGNVEIINILAIFGDYRTAGNWAWEALAFCVREGILDDYEFYIRPLDAITRGEVAEMVYRLLVRANLV